jgi:hypothetical protein
MKLKTRLYLFKRMLRRFFTPQLRKALVYTFYSFMIAIAIVGLTGLGYIAGHTNAVVEMANRHETDIPMCAYKETSVRENPTGYILSDVRAGDVLWVVQLQVPFAVVWYFDGTNWHLGTTTASYLVPCDRITHEAL